MHTSYGSAHDIIELQSEEGDPYQRSLWDLQLNLSADAITLSGFNGRRHSVMYRLLMCLSAGPGRTRHSAIIRGRLSAERSGRGI